MHNAPAGHRSARYSFIHVNRIAVATEHGELFLVPTCKPTIIQDRARIARLEVEDRLFQLNSRSDDAYLLAVGGIESNGDVTPTSGAHAPGRGWPFQMDMIDGAPEGSES